VAKRRKAYSAGFKAKVALAAAKGDKTLSQLTSRYTVHANQISSWKRQMLDGLPELFADGRRKKKGDHETRENELYEQIGRLKMEVDWLKIKVDNLGEA